MKRRCVNPWVLAGLLLLACASSAAAQTYVDKTISTSGSSSQDVIITVVPGHETEVLTTLQQHGASVKSQHPSINGVAASIHGADVNDLAAHGAATITPDAVVHGWGAPGKKAVGASDSLSNVATNGPTVSTIRASLGLAAGAASNLAAGVINGNGVGIAIVDSGIAPSADFDTRILKWKDYVGGRATPYDDFGHGTHIAGLIASNGQLSGYMFQGVAPRANLIVLKVLDKNGAGTTSRVITAIDYAIAHKKQLGIQIINLSLGHPITAPAQFDPLVQAVEQASKAGIVVIAAAGNDGPGYGSINSPGNAPSAITVGAVDGMTTVTRSDDHVEYFSSRGPTWYDGFAKPDVVASGVNLFSDSAAGSTLVTSGVYPTQTVGTAKLLDLSGSSMAAAVATGVVALELDANAQQSTAPLTPNASKAILEYTAVPVGFAQTSKPDAGGNAPLGPADKLTQGSGQVNAAGAIQLSSAINTAAMLNTGWLQAGVTPSTTILGETYAWAQDIIWGTNVFTGNFIYYNARMWDDNIIWGTGVVRGTRLFGSSVKSKQDVDNIIWGTNIAGSTNIVWGAFGADNIIWGTSLAPFRVIGQRVGGTIEWARDDVDNIIWGTLDLDNIIWGTDDGDNIIWGTWDSLDNIIWGTTADASIATGASFADDNIIWGTSAAKSILSKAKDDGDNIIWGTVSGRLVVMAVDDGDNIIWGTADSDNIIWGTSTDNIIWGTDDGDNIIWGTDGDNIIWGTSARGRR